MKNVDANVKSDMLFEKGYVGILIHVIVKMENI